MSDDTGNPIRASGLNLVIAAIVYWNSTYLADAVDHLRSTGQAVSAGLLAPYLAALLGAHRLLPLERHSERD